MKRFLLRMRGWMEEYAYLVTLGCVIAIVAGCAMYTRQIQRDAETGVQAAAQAPETQETATPSITPEVTPMPTIAPLTVRPVMLGAQGVWPVGGRVARPFDGQELIFWEGLGSWKTHMGLDIAGEAGESVLCAADAVVTHVSRDELWGWRVSMEMEDGGEMLYAGLADCCVAAGDAVKRGEQIGTLLEHIPCEAEIGTHLHLELWRDGRAQDPEAMLAER